MPSVAINIVRYNHPFSLLEKCVRAVLAQDLPSFTVQVTENGSKDSVKDELLKLFESDRRFSYADNRANLGFAGAHNVFFSQANAEILLPLNPDTVMTPSYVRTLLGAFDDPKVGAATGKMIKFESLADGSRVLDGTGIVVSRARRGRERGQNQIDALQFDDAPLIFGVSGTAPAYRKSALEKIRLHEREYFDEDFFAYWEDLDLSWRLRLAGYDCAYVPEALIYHSRAVGQSQHGYRRPIEFMKHHRQFPARILRWNWKNQLFCIVKNDFGWSLWRDFPFIVGRQFAMLGYIAIFETRTLGALPELLRLLPKMLRKRKLIQERRVVSSLEIGKWFCRQ